MAILKDVLYDPDPDGQGSGADSGSTNQTDSAGAGDQVDTPDQSQDTPPS